MLPMMSTRPKSACARSPAIHVRALGHVTFIADAVPPSQVISSAAARRSCRRSMSPPTIVAPFAASMNAVACPMPLPHPVSTATLPDKSRDLALRVMCRGAYAHTFAMALRPKGPNESMAMWRRPDRPGENTISLVDICAERFLDGRRTMTMQACGCRGPPRRDDRRHWKPSIGEVEPRECRRHRRSRILTLRCARTPTSKDRRRRPAAAARPSRRRPRRVAGKLRRPSVRSPLPFSRRTRPWRSRRRESGTRLSGASACSLPTSTRPRLRAPRVAVGRRRRGPQTAASPRSGSRRANQLGVGLASAEKLGFVTLGGRKSSVRATA